MAKQRPALKKKLLSTLQKNNHAFSFGQAGEDLAGRFLTSKNYQILDRNIRFKNNEVDLIAIDLNINELVFVEVKSRSTSFVHPSEAVNAKKVSSMQKVAKIYIKAKKLDLDYRFDTVTITADQIEHFENITWNA